VIEGCLVQVVSSYLVFAAVQSLVVLIMKPAHALWMDLFSEDPVSVVDIV